VFCQVVCTWETYGAIISLQYTAIFPLFLLHWYTSLKPDCPYRPPVYTPCFNSFFSTLSVFLRCTVLTLSAMTS
jgi:hypothetical protein